MRPPSGTTSAALTSFRSASQAAASAALVASRATLAPGPALEELQHALSFVPVYAARAAAAAREMRALRARLDRAKARGERLRHAAVSGERLLPGDLNSAASAVLGWATGVAVSAPKPVEQQPVEDGVEAER